MPRLIALKPRSRYVSWPEVSVKIVRFPKPISKRIESLLAIELADQRVLGCRDELPAQSCSAIAARVIGDGRKDRVFHASAEHPTTHQKCFDVDGLTAALQDHHADQAVVAEAIRNSPSIDLDTRCHTKFGDF